MARAGLQPAVSALAVLTVVGALVVWWLQSASQGSGAIEQRAATTKLSPQLAQRPLQRHQEQLTSTASEITVGAPSGVRPEARAPDDGTGSAADRPAATTREPSTTAPPPSTTRSRATPPPAPKRLPPAPPTVVPAIVAPSGSQWLPPRLPKELAVARPLPETIRLLAPRVRPDVELLQRQLAQIAAPLPAVPKYCPAQVTEDSSLLDRLCPMVYPEQHPQLVRFLSSTPSDLQVYVVDTYAPETALTSLCGVRMSKGLLDPELSMWTTYAQKFGAELIIPPALRHHPRYRARDLQSANVVLVEACVMGKGQNGESISKTMDQLLAGGGEVAKRWAARGGLDFAIVLTSDHGVCGNFFEKAYQERPLKRWLEPRVANATLIGNEMSYQNGCTHPAKDFAVPTVDAIAGRSDHNACATAPDLHKRKHFLFHAGKLSSRVRIDLEDALKAASAGGYRAPRELGGGDVLVPESIPRAEFDCEMAKAVFCACPRGKAVWSPRLTQAVLAGCIPVLHADLAGFAFDQILDYDTFTVRIPEQNVSDTLALLESIPPPKVQQMLENVRRVRAAFVYDDAEGFTRAGSASASASDVDVDVKVTDRGHVNVNTDLLAFNLWLRMRDKGVLK